MAEQLIFQIVAADAFTKAFNKLTSHLGVIGKAALATSGAVTAVTGTLFAMTKSTADAYDKFDSLSKKMGVTTEFVSKMSVVSELANVEFGALTGSLDKLQMNLGQAADGTGTAGEALRKLGISITNTNGELKTSEDILPELADAFEDIKSATERSRVAQELFGRGGTEMIKILKDGRKGLEEMGDEAEAMGLVVGKQAAANAEKFNDALFKCKGVLQGLQHVIGEALMPVITGLAEQFSSFVKENREDIISWGKIAVDVLGQATEKISYAVGALIDVWRLHNLQFNINKLVLASFIKAYYSSLDYLVEKTLKFAKAVNFGGIFDEGIASAENWRTGTGVIIRSIEPEIEKSSAKISEYFGKGFAYSTLKVDEFVVKTKASIASLKELGTASVAHVPTGDTGEPVTMPSGETGSEAGEPVTMLPDPADYQEKLAELASLHDEYFLDENEKIQQWYEEQQAIHAGHQDALTMLDDIYEEKKLEVQEEKMEAYQEQLDALNEMYSEALDTDEQRLDKWFKTQQKKYQGDQNALLKLQKVYNKKKEALDKEEHEKDLELKQAKLEAAANLFSGIANLASVFGKRAFGLMKIASISEATINSYTAATNALAHTPGPPPIPQIAAFAALALGMSNVAKISQMKAPAYHGGMTNVPREQTVLLDKGERIVSPKQNEDLTEFLKNKNNQSNVHIEKLSILENATNAENLLNISKSSWEEIVEAQIVPALRTMTKRGIAFA
jgi:hypothetical protein